MSNEATFPQNWQLGQEYDPNDHMMQYKRYDKKAQREVVTDYLTVQQRMIWFVRDQRTFIVNGLAKVPYLIQTDLSSEREDWAEFKTTVRDVLGNECTMYGSESKSDFPDYREKASTKSLGRALAMLGYGTQYAPEISDGEEERPVDSPVARQNAPQPAQRTQAPVPHVAPSESQQNAPQVPTPISDSQWVNAWCKRRNIAPVICAEYSKMVGWGGVSAIKAQLEKNGDDIAIVMEDYAKEKKQQEATA